MPPSTSAASRPVLVYGAAGHTARFVVQSLRAQGHHVLLAGRDAARLRAAHPGRPASEFRVLDIGDAKLLQAAASEAAGVVNCAGPFADTLQPVLQAALAAGVHYVDVAAEQAVARSVFEDGDARARAAGICALPAVAFYGGLGDLLATAAMGDWPEAEAVDLYIGLDSWHPTLGTRKTGQRNAGLHVVYRDGQLQPPPATPSRTTWRFGSAFGEQAMLGLSVADAVTIPRHLRVRDVNAWMNEAPLAELRSADTPPPAAVDAGGRSAQRFRVEAVVRRAGSMRRTAASGQDIYAVTGPIAAQAVTRLLAGEARGRAGAFALGQLFDARAFLESLAPEGLSLDWSQ